jgi:hypothetical protein
MSTSPNLEPPVRFVSWAATPTGGRSTSTTANRSSATTSPDLRSPTSAQPTLPAGERTIGFEFEKTGAEQFGAGGTARLFVDDEQVGENGAFAHRRMQVLLDETFDVGCDKGSPVTED